MVTLPHKALPKYPVYIKHKRSPGQNLNTAGEKGQAQTRHKHGVKVVLDRLARLWGNLRRDVPCLPLSTVDIIFLQNKVGRGYLVAVTGVYMGNYRVYVAVPGSMWCFNPLKTSPKYTRAGVYGKCMLYM